MGAPERTYGPLSKQAFDNIRADLAAVGAQVADACDGSTSAPHGFTVSWHYEPPGAGTPGSLRITLDGPWLLRGAAWSAIEGHIKKYEGT